MIIITIIISAMISYKFVKILDDFYDHVGTDVQTVHETNLDIIRTMIFNLHSRENKQIFYYQEIIVLF